MGLGRCENYAQEKTNKLNFMFLCSQVTPSPACSSIMPLPPAADSEEAFLVREEKQTLSVSNRLLKRDSSQPGFTLLFNITCVWG